MSGKMKTAGSKRQLVLALLLLGAAMAVFGMQWWSFSGRVISRGSKQPIANATVLVTLHARPLGSPIPHGWTAASRCLASEVVQTDSRGAFTLRTITWGFAFVDKSFSVDVFKAGLVYDGSMHSYPQHDPLSIEVSNLDVESTNNVRRTISRAASLGWHMSGCDKAGEIAVIDAMEWAIANTRSEEEKKVVHLRCREALDRSLSRQNLSTRADGGVPDKWPEDVAPSCGRFLRR